MLFAVVSNMPHNRNSTSSNTQAAAAAAAISGQHNLGKGKTRQSKPSPGSLAPARDLGATEDRGCLQLWNCTACRLAALRLTPVRATALKSRRCSGKLAADWGSTPREMPGRRLESVDLDQCLLRKLVVHLHQGGGHRRRQARLRGTRAMARAETGFGEVP